MNEYKSAGDIISTIFQQIDSEQLNSCNELYSVWRKIFENIDEAKIADHCRILDLKNDILLIEVDHPGWIQLLQFYRNTILKELHKKVPVLKIKTVSFKLRGDDYTEKIMFQKEETNEKEHKPLLLRDLKDEELKKLFDSLKKQLK